MSNYEQTVDRRERVLWIRRLAWLQRLSGQIIRFVYTRTGGRLGGRVRGMPVLLLTTTGRRTGLERTTPLIFLRHDRNYVVAASAAAADSHPGWYYNLTANPTATVQVGPRRMVVTARVAEHDERDDLYRRFVAANARFRIFELSTSRNIPVVVLQPETETMNRDTLDLGARKQRRS